MISYPCKRCQANEVLEGARHWRHALGRSPGWSASWAWTDQAQGRKGETRKRPGVARMNCPLVFGWCSWYTAAHSGLGHTWGTAATQLSCSGLLPRCTAGGRDAGIAGRRKERDGVWWIVDCAMIVVRDSSSMLSSSPWWSSSSLASSFSLARPSGRPSRTSKLRSKTSACAKRARKRPTTGALAGRREQLHRLTTLPDHGSPLRTR
jgi:hypothetical protein